MSDDTTPDQIPDEGQNAETPAGETTGDYIKRMVAEALAEAKTQNPEGDPTKPDPVIPVPKLDHAPQTREEAADVGKMFAQFRAEVAQLRTELQSHRPRTVNVSAPQETVEQREEARLAAISEASHYCPGCGRLSKYPRECIGTPAGPHKVIEMVSTDELGGDPANHAKAPSTDPDHPDLIAA